MEIATRYKIHDAAARETTRYAIRGVQIKDGRAIATNGRILASVPVMIEGDDDASEPLVVPASLVKTALAKPQQRTTARMHLNGQATARLKDGSTVSADYDDARFPDTDSVIDGVRKQAVAHTVYLNPQMLLDLAKAIGFEPKNGLGVRLDLPADPSSPIRVEAMSSPEAFGIIMPVTSK